MNVVIFGGTGSLGRALIKDLLSDNHQVYVVTRNRQSAANKVAGNVAIIEWDYNSPLSSVYRFKDLDAVINLAGKSIGDQRWTDSVKQEILESRIKTTHAIVAAINDRSIQPKVFINASAVGYYGPREEQMSENDAAGSDFLAEVCRKWESEAYKVQSGSTRVVTVRIGVILENHGALRKMALPFKFYLGGPLGNGTQWLSWIHKQDLIRMFRFIVEHEEVIGSVNGTSPNPVRMKVFSKVLGEVLRKPSWFPVPEFLLKIVLGQMSEMLLHGQRAIPEKIVAAGFEFRFSELKPAITDALQS